METSAESSSEEGKKKAKGPRKSRGPAGGKPGRASAGEGKKRPGKGKSLVIVESPAKARTIHKYLGDGFEVRASMGHVRDLPEKTLGVDVEDGFRPQYQTIRGKGKTIEELRKLVRGASSVYLAPDLDREGEAIAWHLVEALSIPPEKAYRVTFNEITKGAIQAAFANPGRIRMAKVEAQQARRILDRLVGYELSPLLWKKVTRGLSAGRVQSVAVKLVVDREKEIRAFVAEEYWRVRAKLAKRPAPPEGVLRPTFEAELVKVAGEKPSLSNEAAVGEVLARLAGAEYSVASVEQKERSDKAPPPFTTSTLQQKGATVLRYSAKKTMMLAQQLYEGVELGGEGAVALITYMRTDSVRVSKDSLEACRVLIAGTFGEKYLPEEPNFFKEKKGAQEAHEAIRPTDPNRMPDSVKPYLERDLYRLYKLIWRRFVASQMKPAEFLVTTAEIEAGPATFQAKGRVLRFDGHTVLTGIHSDEEPVLPELAAGEPLDLAEPLLRSQHFTQPPPRYGEAALVRTLEKKGIGRPSTYAPILSTIQERGYVKLVERRFHATDLGILVTDLLVEHFPQILDVDFTSQMEGKLDRIEEAEGDWEGERIRLLRDFYSPFSKWLETAYDKMVDVKKAPEPSPYACEDCGKPMFYRWNKNGRFLGCSGYPECRNIRPVDMEGKPLHEELSDEKCDKCQKPMKVKTGRLGRFLACTGYPECRFTLSLDKDGKVLRPEVTDEKCPYCDAMMVIKKGRRGAHKACSSTPPYHDIGKTCEKCGKAMLVKYTRRGPFLACSGFPKCRNARNLAEDETGTRPGSVGQPDDQPDDKLAAS